MNKSQINLSTYYAIAFMCFRPDAFNSLGHNIKFKLEVEK